jgi:hypothetical protein
MRIAHAGQHSSLRSGEATESSVRRDEHEQQFEPRVAAQHAIDRAGVAQRETDEREYGDGCGDGRQRWPSIGRGVAQRQECTGGQRRHADEGQRADQDGVVQALRFSACPFHGTRILTSLTHP